MAAGTFRLPDGQKLRVQSTRRYIAYYLDRIVGRPVIDARSDDLAKAINRAGPSGYVLDTDTGEVVHTGRARRPRPELRSPSPPRAGGGVMTAFTYSGRFDYADEAGTLWRPIGEWWTGEVAGGLRAKSVVNLSMSPGDATLYEIMVNVTGGFHGRPLAVSVFTPYQRCALLPLVNSYDDPTVDEYVLSKFGHKAIPQAHRCARLLICRIAGLAADTIAGRIGGES